MIPFSFKQQSSKSLDINHHDNRLKTLQEALLEEFHKKSITQTTLDSLQGCLNTIGENAIVVSLAIVACSGTNILIDFFLLIGACCGVR